ncbi:hypothetical protein J6590_020039 [Homalodisca vitripennis]|nr:hypothetical protein J6590_020039 [Homalodisca vitripennis]
MWLSNYISVLVRKIDDWSIIGMINFLTNNPGEKWSHLLTITVEKAVVAVGAAVVGAIKYRRPPRHTGRRRLRFPPIHFGRQIDRGESMYEPTSPYIRLRL